MYLFEPFYTDSLFYNTHEGTCTSLSFPVSQNAVHRLLELETIPGKNIFILLGSSNLIGEQTLCAELYK